MDNPPTLPQTTAIRFHVGKHLELLSALHLPNIFISTFFVTLHEFQKQLPMCGAGNLLFGTKTPMLDLPMCVSRKEPLCSYKYHRFPLKILHYNAFKSCTHNVIAGGLGKNGRNPDSNFYSFTVLPANH